VERICDFALGSVVQRVVNDRSLLLEWILGVNGISTSSGETKANNNSNDDTYENSSTDGGNDSSGALEEAGTVLNVVSASLICAHILIARTGGGVGGRSSSSNARLSRVSIRVGRVVEQAKLGEIADLDVVLATKSGIASVNSTIVTVITAEGSMQARAVDATVNCAGVEVVAINWVNLTTLALNTCLRAAKVCEWASCIVAR